MKTITPKDLKERLAKEEVLLIDVREPEEYRTEKIQGARLIPLGEISVEKLPAKSISIVMYCRSGKRSATALAKILAQDPKLDVYSLEGGLLGWKQAGFSVEKLTTNKLSIEQQTQLVIGFLTFSGTLLGAFFHSAFYMIPALTGLGLMFTGFTGFCGMAKIISQMPWNR